MKVSIRLRKSECGHTKFPQKNFIQRWKSRRRPIIGNLFFKSINYVAVFVAVLGQSEKPLRENELKITTIRSYTKICADGFKILLELSSMPVVFPLSGFTTRLYFSAAVQSCKKWSVIICYARCISTTMEEIHVTEVSVQSFSFLHRTFEYCCKLGPTVEGCRPLSLDNCMKTNVNFV